MNDFGLTPKGFKRKQYTDIVADMEMRARELFGENINLTNRSFLGILIRLVAWFFALWWQLLEFVYNSAFVDTAEGVSLDHVAKYIGIARRPAERARGVAVFTGEEGTVIPAGVVVAAGDIAFVTLTEEMIDTTGSVSIEIEAVEPGKEGNVPAGMITDIVTPIPGLESVTNPEPTVGGRDQETDEEFRARYLISTAAGGASTVDSIRASLLGLPGVRAANVIENTSMEVDAEGRPPKSIHCYTLGGNRQEIAQTILDTKAAGIETHGEIEETVYDLGGHEHTIRFSFAEVVDIYLQMTIKRNVRFPLDGEERIKQNIVTYIGGEDDEGVLHPGLGMGQTVTYTKLIDIIYNTEGIEDLSLDISTDGVTWVRENITVGMNQVAETDFDKVVITYAE